MPIGGTLTLLRLVPRGLRGARGLCVTGGSPGSAGSRPRRDRPRGSDGPPKKARHNDHRREPSSRYSPQVSPWHTAGGTKPGGSLCRRRTRLRAPNRGSGERRRHRPGLPFRGWQLRRRAGGGAADIRTRPAPRSGPTEPCPAPRSGAGRSPAPSHGPRSAASREAAQSRHGPRECRGHRRQRGALADAARDCGRTGAGYGGTRPRDHMGL
jgi:hypothetical protein